MLILGVISREDLKKVLCYFPCHNPLSSVEGLIHYMRETTLKKKETEERNCNAYVSCGHTNINFI